MFDKIVVAAVTQHNRQSRGGRGPCVSHTPKTRPTEEARVRRTPLDPWLATDRMTRRGGAASTCEMMTTVAGP